MFHPWNSLRSAVFLFRLCDYQPYRQRVFNCLIAVFSVRLSGILVTPSLPPLGCVEASPGSTVICYNLEGLS